MGVSQNRSTLKLSISMGFFRINHPFWISRYGNLQGCDSAGKTGAISEPGEELADHGGGCGLGWYELKPEYNFTVPCKECIGMCEDLMISI